MEVSSRGDTAHTGRLARAAGRYPRPPVRSLPSRSLISARSRALTAAAGCAIVAAGAGSAVAAPMSVSTQTLLTPPGGGLVTGYSPRTSAIDVGSPSSSLNGQIVAFSSNARDLGSTGPAGTTQVFVRNAARGTTTLVSRASKNADGTAGDPGLASSTQPSISGDGLYVVFTTKSTNISPDDLDGTADVYVRNTATGITYLVSRATNAAGGAAGNGNSTEPVISTDGRYVAFTSTASNLVANDTNGKSDVFVRDLRRNETYLMSVNKAGTASAAGASSAPSIAPYSRAVAFQSDAHDITGDDGLLTTDVYVRVPGSRLTWLASRATGADGGPAELDSLNPSISADGNTVAFESRSVGLTPLQNPPLVSQVYIRQRQTNLTLLVSRAEGQLGGASDRDADNASISPDGLYVGFASAGTGLSTEDNDGFLGLTPTRDVFVRDLIAGSTTLISRKGLTPTGGAGAVVSAPSSEPFVGTTANFVLFTSEADIAPLSVGKPTNVYSARLQQPLSVSATPPATFGYRRFDTDVTCTSTCSIYATAQLKLTVGGVTSVKGSYMYGFKTPVQPNTPTKVAVQVYNTAISNWLKAGIDKGGSATITIAVQATGLRGEKAKTVVEAPFVPPVVATPSPTPAPAS